MARIVTYTFIWTGLMVLLYLAGIQTQGFSVLLGAMGVGLTANGPALSLVASIVAAVALIFILGAATGTITIGFITRQSTESGFIAPIAGILATVMTTDTFALIAYFFSTAPKPIAWIITLIMLPFYTTYLISIIQWWRGSDI